MAISRFNLEAETGNRKLESRDRNPESEDWLFRFNLETETGNRKLETRNQNPQAEAWL